VTPAEVCTVEPPATPAPTPGCHFEFVTVDTDGDSFVTRAEYDASVPPAPLNKGAILRRAAQIDEDFRAWDTNGDGRFVRGEICNE